MQQQYLKKCPEFANTNATYTKNKIEFEKNFVNLCEKMFTSASTNWIELSLFISV